MRISDWSSDVCSSDLTPRTNGKAERFIQTVLRECAYARPFRSSSQRAGALAPWTDDYNTLRPHPALAHQPPFAKRSEQRRVGNEGVSACSARWAPHL